MIDCFMTHVQWMFYDTCAVDVNTKSSHFCKQNDVKGNCCFIVASCRCHICLPPPPPNIIPTVIVKQSIPPKFDMFISSELNFCKLNWIYLPEVPWIEEILSLVGFWENDSTVWINRMNKLLHVIVPCILFTVNAADNKQRDPNMSTIKIDIDP